MSNPAFFANAKSAAKSPALRKLLTQLAKFAKEHQRLSAEFAEQITANRTRREGKPVKLSRAARQFMRDADTDAAKAERELKQAVTQMTDAELLQSALFSWNLAADFHHPEVYHADDRPAADQIARLIRDARQLILAYYRAHGLKLPAIIKSRGLSFVAVFKSSGRRSRETLGADHVSIQPALASLDTLAAENDLNTLSNFVEPDPDQFAGGKAKWFAVADCRPVLQGLIQLLTKKTRRVKNAQKVLEDLCDLEKELEAAPLQLKFHFVILD